MVNDSIDEYWSTKGLDMQSEGKKIKQREKRNKKREFTREKHLKEKYSAAQMAEHDHMIRYHTNPEDLTAEQQVHPGEDPHAGHNHELSEDEARRQQVMQPLDVGTTRMKLDGFEDIPENAPPTQVAHDLTDEELRKELGL